MLDFETLFEMKSSAKPITVYPPGTALPQPFAFVLNVSGLVGCDKLEIVPGLHPETRQRKGDQVYKEGHRLAVRRTLRGNGYGKLEDRNKDRPNASPSQTESKFAKSTRSWQLNAEGLLLSANWILPNKISLRWALVR